MMLIRAPTLTDQNIKRTHAHRKDTSGSTKSEEGKAFRDGLMTLKQTCYRLGENFWEFLKAWFRRKPMDLAQCVRNRYRAATSP